MKRNVLKFVFALTLMGGMFFSEKSNAQASKTDMCPSREGNSRTGCGIGGTDCIYFDCTQQ